MNAAARLCEFAAAPHALPDAVRADAERLLADTLAGGAAGAKSQEAGKLSQAILTGAEGPARLLSGGTAPTPEAAFFNGFAVHCLEWDAVHEGAVVHALSVVTAALLAKSDEMGGSDRQDFLTALAIGVDIASGMGIAASGPMAFFRPATAGVIGATLACSRLAGLPQDRFANALGLAYSFTAGTMQAHVEASIALPLQIGNAARAAISATAMAETGMDGPHDVLDGPFGYNALIEPIEISAYCEGLGTIWRISEVATKPFPSGRASHGALGELERLYREGLRLDQVERIELFAPPLIERLVGRPYKSDMTPAYARLCLAILAPLMLRDGVIDPALFDGEDLHAAELVALASKVSATLDGNPDGNAMAPQRLVVTRKDGSVSEHPISATLGSVEHPMDAHQSAGKYSLCRKLAGEDADPQIFASPLSYATDPK